MIKTSRDGDWGWGIQISCSDFQTVEGTFKKHSQKWFDLYNDCKKFIRIDMNGTLICYFPVTDPL